MYGSLIFLGNPKEGFIWGICLVILSDDFIIGKISRNVALLSMGTVVIMAISTYCLGTRDGHKCQPAR